MGLLENTMSKRTILTGLLGIAFLFLLVGIASASNWGMYNYGYNSPGYFDSVSYHTSKSSGWYGGPVQSSSTDYNKVTSDVILRDGTRQKTTSYVRVDRESPRMYSPYAYGSYMNMGYNYYPSYGNQMYYAYPNYNTGNMMGNYNSGYGWNNGW